MDPKETNDSSIFNWNGILIRQQDDVHKIGTDAILLGAWIPTIVKQASSILDIGTGTGVLALMLAHSFPDSKVDAIDLNEQAIQLAMANVSSNLQRSRMNVRMENILDSTSDSRKYALVISNPPYHLEKVLSPVFSRQASRHLAIPIESWMKGMIRRLAINGHLCVIIPAAQANDWIAAANQSDLYCSDRLEIFSFIDDPMPVRTLLHFSHALAKPRMESLVIYQKDKRYTSEFLRLTGIRPSKADEI